MKRFRHFFCLKEVKIVPKKLTKQTFSHYKRSKNIPHRNMGGILYRNEHKYKHNLKLRWNLWRLFPTDTSKAVRVSSRISTCVKSFNKSTKLSAHLFPYQDATEVRPISLKEKSMHWKSRYIFSKRKGCICSVPSWMICRHGKLCP